MMCDLPTSRGADRFFKLSYRMLLQKPPLRRSARRGDAPHCRVEDRRRSGTPTGSILRCRVPDLAGIAALHPGLRFLLAVPTSGH
jgi:hypothetical protein